VKLGISTYTFTWGIGISGYPAPTAPITPERLVAIAAGLGVDALQIADNMPVHEFDLSRRRRLFEQAAEAGIAIELGARGTDVDTLRRYIRIAEEGGVSILRSVPTATIAPGDQDAERSFVATSAREIASLIDELEDAGVTLCLENYEGMSTAALASLVRAVDSPAVRVCLDTLNSLGRSEGYESVVCALGPLTGNLHIKDYAIRRVDHRLGFTVAGTQAGEGDLPIADLVRRVPHDVTAVLELWTPWQGSLDATISKEAQWARSSVDHLRSVLPR